MDPVSKLSQVIAILGRQGSSHGVKAANGGRSEKSRKSSSNAPSKPTLSELRGHIGKRILAINPDDPRRHQKAVRVFLETVLLNELGAGLINDPRFYDLVTEVQSAMEGDESLKGDLYALIGPMLDRPDLDSQQ